MKTWKVKRGFTWFEVEALSRNKAKYAAYKQYRRKRKNPLAFFPWVTKVSKVMAAK